MSDEKGQVAQCKAISRKGTRCKLPAMRRENAEFYIRTAGGFDAELCQKHQTAPNVKKVEEVA